MSLDSTLRISIGALYKAVLDLSAPVDSLDYSKSFTLPSGIGSGQADKIFHDKRTLGPSGTENLDLAGTLLDPFGVVVTFLKLKFILIVADPTNVNQVQVIRPAANGVAIFAAASDQLNVNPGGFFALLEPDAAGVPVVAGTGDLITITNSAGGTSVIYDVVLIGTSA